ncbi:hypothetical protein LTR10_022070 [Elasticomyces elasticus]|uniref:Prion-inhibition and propagation HeLo domain-containing protein n=1 Tax=Exophiala sideris TaxID=1016849 RepID=A0ABR0JMF2_9EURO|nr:hypothetical protein LTR10_022070 [Elasticomyces elasticus]KAK5037684.1 hypothetical protein LTS07_001151 [Exophiala sideris]KAK5043666.1 hypothetical protein LTR13_000020 [Exophiala sideris]KAK5067165.1 hypothetical protein LTR69_001152 [Exophiala sideris]KAK5182498.1 hypothetical protein LTR44_004889 [Eurotiomycetes sp. CCFEE 6388]
MTPIAVTSSPSQALQVEASFLQAQAELIRDVGNDVHFAASIIGYRAYDYETRAACLRKAAWDMRSADAMDTRLAEESADQFRRARLVDNAAELMDAVQRVKIGLQTVIEIAYRSGLLEDNHGSQEDGKTSSVLPDVPASVGALTESNTGYSLSSSFLKAQESRGYVVTLGDDVQPQMPAEVSVRAVPPKDSSTDLEDNRFETSTDSSELTSYSDMQSATATFHECADAQSSTQPTKEEEVLEWIPSNLRLSRRSIHMAADGVYQSLMMRDQGREQMERAG